jgi:hypothetical protein
MLDLNRCARMTIGEEFAAAELGDVRRTSRLQRIAERAMQAPAVSFPRMAADDSELEGFYRFFNCEDFGFEEVVEPHFEATLGRMRAAQGPVLVVHDTTDLSFGGQQERDGLGRTQGKRQGFLLHLALAVLPGEERLPLGTCGVVRVRRTEYKNSSRKSSSEMWKDPNRESLRWSKLVEQVDARASDVDCIHLMDREGDNFDLIALLLAKDARFVVRGCHDRALADGDQLSEQLAALKPVVRREIELSPRPDDGRPPASQKTHPPRRSRPAEISVAGTEVTLRRPSSAHVAEDELTLNAVCVWEAAPPPGEPPVSWVLLTSEPVDTQEQLLSIVDYYRSRWVIEEFFKALKSGCSIEKRQLESYDALSVALGVFLPVAWRLLLARSLSRAIPNAPALIVATKVQLELLRHKLKLKQLPLTAEAATFAIAKLGGHLKRNGPPGWLTLGRGLESLLIMEAGWRAAMAAGRSDQ